MSETWLMRLVLAVAMILTLAGCSAGSGLVVDDSGDAVLVSTASSSGASTLMVLEGTLAITEDGCFGIDNDRSVFPTVFPVGTVPDREGIYLVGYGHVAVGDRLEGEGGFASEEALPKGLPEECSADEVAVFDLVDD